MVRGPTSIVVVMREDGTRLVERESYGGWWGKVTERYTLWRTEVMIRIFYHGSIIYRVLNHSPKKEGLILTLG